MPKKGENSRAVEAKAKKNAVKDEKEQVKQKEVEDEMWKDDLPKNLKNKLLRKEEQEKKRADKLDRKLTNKILCDEEVQKVTAEICQPKQPQIKITRAEIEAEKERREAAVKKAAGGDQAQSKTKIVKQTPHIEENLNRFLNADEEATTIDEALKMLSVDEGSAAADRHPEKRCRVQFNNFAERRLPQLKIENPTLRLTQLKNLLWTEWQKSPENPLLSR